MSSDLRQAVDDYVTLRRAARTCTATARAANSASPR